MKLVMTNIILSLLIHCLHLKLFIKYCSKVSKTMMSLLISFKKVIVSKSTFSLFLVDSACVTRPSVIVSYILGISLCALVGCSKDKGTGPSMISNVLNINSPDRSRILNSNNMNGLINYPPDFPSTLAPIEIAMTVANLLTFKILATISHENYQYLIYNKHNSNIDFFYTSVIQNDPALFYFSAVIDEPEDICFVKALLDFKDHSTRYIKPQHNNTKRNLCPSCGRSFTLRDGFEFVYKNRIRDIESEFGIRGSSITNNKIQCNNCFIASCVKHKAHSNSCASLLKKIYIRYNNLNQSIADNQYGECSTVSSNALQLRKAYKTLSCIECNAKIIDLHLDKVDDFMHSNVQGNLFQCSSVEGRGLETFAANNRKEARIYINYSICPRCWLTKQLKHRYLFRF